MKEILEPTFIGQTVAIIILLGTPIIAYLKGRNVLLWILFTLIGSVFAFIAVLFVEKQKKCPMCNERISARAKICKHCHSLLQEEN